MIRVAHLVYVVLVCSALLSAQSSSKEDVISATTEIVTVPVIVTDSSGKAVRGLKQEDFQVRENGKEQRVASFEEVTSTPSTVAGSTVQGGIYTNRLSNENPMALGILVVDFVNTRTISQVWALRGAVSFLNRWKGKGGFQQPMMVAAITNQGLRIIHQATSSPEVLEAALLMLRANPSLGADNNQSVDVSSFNPPRGPDNEPIVQRHPGDTDAQYADRLKEAKREAQFIDEMERGNEVIRQAATDADTKTTMWALMALANGVAGIPGRKAMIWCSESFPFKAVQDDFQSPQWVNKHGSSNEDPDLKPLRDGTLFALNRANISVYPVNAAGLLTPGFFDVASSGRSSMIASQLASKLVRAGEGDMETRASAHIVADETAGITCMSTNDISDCLGRALEDASHYYMLTYSPDPKPKGNGYRKIKVEVKGEKLNVRARDSYWHGAVPGYGLSPKSDLAVALGSDLDYTALPILLKFTGLKPGPQGKRIAEFVIGVDGRALSIDEDHGNHISLLIGAQAKVGDNPTVISIDTKLKPELVPQIRAKQLTHNGEMELTPGKYDVRLVIRDNLNGRIGSVVAPIEVQ